MCSPLAKSKPGIRPEPEKNGATSAKTEMSHKEPDGRGIVKSIDQVVEETSETGSTAPFSNSMFSNSGTTACKWKPATEDQETDRIRLDKESKGLPVVPGMPVVKSETVKL
ncbi:hypothetical protein U1Q18_018788 [Sarracenia purpurea var. burkii]